MLFVHDGILHATLSGVWTLHYQDRWIGRNGQVLWPPRSPDLTRGLYLRDCLKGTVYLTTVNTRNELWPLIRAAATTRYTRGSLTAYQEFLGVTGFSCAQEIRGEHFQQLL